MKKLDELKLEFIQLQKEIVELEMEFEKMVKVASLHRLEDAALVLSSKRTLYKELQHQIDNHPDTLLTIKSRLEEYIRIIDNDLRK